MKRLDELFQMISLLVLIFLSIQQTVNADKNQNRTYIDFTEPIPCVRRFNATHQIGCGGVQTGLVYAVRGQYSLDRLSTNITPDVLGSRRVVVIVTPNWFAPLIDWALNSSSTASSILAGIVLAENLTTVATGEYSDDVKIPNSEFSAYKDRTEWNPAGRGAMFNDFKYPVYIMTNPDEAEIVFNVCYDQINRHYFGSDPIRISSSVRLCGMQLGMDMSGAVSSRVCVRRSNIIHTLDFNYFCDPLGGSTYLTPFNIASKDPFKANLILSARMDTFTLFESYTPGANEPMSALVAIMVLADLLRPFRNQFDKINPIFVLFDNEAFDYGGSSRFVRDLVNNQMPIVDLTNGQTINLSMLFSIFSNVLISFRNLDRILFWGIFFT